MTDICKEVKEALGKITPGDWEVEHDPNEGYLIYHVVNGERVYLMQFSLSSDAEFSASAPTYCRKLIERVERLEKDNLKLKNEPYQGEVLEG
jgi:hypothetical protein